MGIELRTIAASNLYVILPRGGITAFKDSFNAPYLAAVLLSVISFGMR